MEPQKTTMTPEQIQLGIQLEGIFMPQARRQREIAYGKQANSTDDPEQGASLRFVHYTSAEAALSIITGKRIWMRNTTCMSDYREVQHGFDMLTKFFSDKEKLGKFVASLDACVSGAALEAINLFNGWWSDTLLNTYITSISEHEDNEDFHGRLSMWRAFGGNTARVAIVFGIPRVSGGASALNIMFSPVAYLTEVELESVLNEVIANIRENCALLRSIDRQIIIGTVFNMLLAGVTCLKHEGFREEREWRAIYSPKRNKSLFMESSIEAIGGIPQLVYKVPLDVSVAPVLAELDFARMFDRLIIGPSPYPWAIREAFLEALSRAGVKDADNRVVVSGIPIRA